MKASPKKVISIILNVLLWMFVVFSVIITIMVFTANANKDGVPAIGGKAPISILTDSMSPTFNAGDLIICNMLTDADKKTMEVGDIITFYSDLNGDNIDEINTHRIVSVDKTNPDAPVYTTRGDNHNKEFNKDFDEKGQEPDYYNDKHLVPCTDVICTYDDDKGTKLPGFGSFLSFLQTSTGFLVIIVIPLILFFLFELYKFIKTLLEVKGVSKTNEAEIKRRAIEEYLRQQAENAKQPDTAADVKPESNNGADTPVQPSGDDNNKDNGKDTE